MHDAKGCERRCWHFSQSTNQLIVAGREVNFLIFILIFCFFADGHGADKVQLPKRQGQIALVTEQEAHIQ